MLKFEKKIRRQKVKVKVTDWRTLYIEHVSYISDVCTNLFSNGIDNILYISREYPYICDVCDFSSGKHALKVYAYIQGNIHVPVMFVINRTVSSKGTSLCTDKESFLILLCIWYRV